MPGTTITISGPQRDGLYELVRNHLGSVVELWDALERDKDFATAARLGLEFSEDFELLEDIGWGEEEGRESFELTMPVHDLTEMLKRLHGEAEQVLVGKEEPSARLGRTIWQPTSATCAASMPAKSCWSGSTRRRAAQHDRDLHDRR